MFVLVLAFTVDEKNYRHSEILYFLLTWCALGRVSSAVRMIRHACCAFLWSATAQAALTVPHASPILLRRFSGSAPRLITLQERPGCSRNHCRQHRTMEGGAGWLRPAVQVQRRISRLECF